MTYNLYAAAQKQTVRRQIFMKWPADAYTRVFYSEVYNGDLFYELLQSWGGGHYQTGSIRGG